jgi:hypothetical protein
MAQCASLIAPYALISARGRVAKNNFVFDLCEFEAALTFYDV